MLIRKNYKSHIRKKSSYFRKFDENEKQENMEGVKSSMSQEKKTAEICVRVTPTEKKELQEKADAAHLSLSRYLVKSGSDHKMLQTQNIARLIYEIRKIGININQIAHVANGQGFILQSDLASVDRQMEAVFEITKKIIKATYDEKEANIKTLERKIDKLMERVDAYGDG